MAKEKKKFSTRTYEINNLDGEVRCRLIVGDNDMFWVFFGDTPSNCVHEQKDSDLKWGGWIVVTPEGLSEDEYSNGSLFLAMMEDNEDNLIIGKEMGLYHILYRDRSGLSHMVVEGYSYQLE